MFTRVGIARQVLNTTLWARTSRVSLTLALIAVSSANVAFDVRAQIDPQVRENVVPAVLQVAIQIEVTENGTTSWEYVPIGSGTVVSADGLVLTNFHVVDMDSHQLQLDAWEHQASEDGEALSFRLDAATLLLLGTDGSSPPEPMYQATVVRVDEALDLAVLRITTDAYGAPISSEGQPFPFVPLGDSSRLRQGDLIDLFGYPLIADGTLTYTAGVVSGFNFKAGIDGPAWIITDATMSGGSSGGAAFDRTGQLIGVPTQGAALDCRPGDTNGDGEVDSADVGCVPTGGSIGQIRPINLAEPLLVASGLTDSDDRESSPTPAAVPSPTPTAEPRPTPTAKPEPSPELTVTPDPTIHKPSLVLNAPPDDIYCSTGPIYAVGERVVVVGITAKPNEEPVLRDSLWNGHPLGDVPLPIGSVLEITGSLLESGICDWWPVIVAPASDSATLTFADWVAGPDTAEAGMTGFVHETRVRSVANLCSFDPAFEVGSRVLVGAKFDDSAKQATLYHRPALEDLGVVRTLPPGTLVEILDQPFPIFDSYTAGCSSSWHVRVVEIPGAETISPIASEGWMHENELVSR